ncbi:MAG: hypothetical protein H7099_18475 [Gemmatimonadaceae bacterium]|nr:hypothetical protein [Gemmatimonadaceae bacterium]
MMFVPREPEKRSPGAIAGSVVLHVLLAAVMLRVVVGSNGIAEWLIGPQGTITKEKIQMVAVQPSGGNADAGGAPVNATVKASTPRTTSVFTAPTSIPTAAPDASGGRGGSGGGTGSGYGSGSGAGVKGVVPGYDPRLYPGAAEPARIARTPKERLDSVITERFAEYSDSVSRNPRSNVSEDGKADLTFTRGGKKYGWTQRGIVLGNITLPAPLLALLPLNRIGGNPSALLRAENPWQMRTQIQAGAQVALNAETFNERVKRIRERRDRERKDGRDGQPTPIPAPIQQQP